MSKSILIGIGIVAVLVIVGAAAYILRPPAEASKPIEAISVDLDDMEAEEKAADTDQQVSAPSSEEMLVSGEQAENSTDADDPLSVQVTDENEQVLEQEIDETPVVEQDTMVSVSEGIVVFSIVQAESEVRFILGELLSGVPTTVVGATDQVAGEIAIDPENPVSTKVGVIRVNARTFATDNNFRNRAINNSILETGKFEYVTFSPSEIANFPENPSIGEALEFQISGDLTVRDITNPVTFDVVVTVVSENRLEGSASANIARADYGLQIPEVPRVADVDEEVLLEIEFVALAN
jgi:polyisoprenoid-binding protein YceI